MQLAHRREPANTFLDKLQIETVAGLFMILGCGAFAALFTSILSHPALQIGELELPRVIWRFLQHFGVIRPLLIMAAGFLLIRLGLRLRTRYIGAARWGQNILIWLLLLTGIAALQSLFTNTGGRAFDLVILTEGLRQAFPWLLFGGMFAAAYWTLASHKALYVGDEHIEEQSARRAWTLLVPTLTIFVVIAVSPLEQVFIASLTDARFADSQTPQFIGLENYSRLLGFRIDPLDCQRGDNGLCLTEMQDGIEQIVYPNPRGVLGDEYRQQRFREFTSFNLNGVHYVVSARDVEFLSAALNSLIYTVAAIFFQLTLGMFIAMLLASRMKGIGYLRVAMLIPLAIPTLIATQFWDVMFTEDATGVINSILMSLNVIQEPQAWLLKEHLQIPAVVLVIVWKETPGMALLLLPGLLAISKEVYEAAQVDGLNRVQRFLQITLPMMRPTIGVALVLRTMVTLRVFDVFDIMLGRTRYSMSTYAYNTLTPGQELGYSSAISVTIFLIILVFTVIYMRTLRIDET
jgi:trehalose/maltose transport system permease protein